MHPKEKEFHKANGLLYIIIVILSMSTILGVFSFFDLELREIIKYTINVLSKPFVWIIIISIFFLKKRK